VEITTIRATNLITRIRSSIHPPRLILLVGSIARIWKT